MVQGCHGADKGNYGENYVRTAADQKNDALAPLRRAMEEVDNLNEAVAKAEYRPKEERLRSLGQELSKAI
jgi:hypothetical protein